jgi:tetratricopeptide (TPR) repeat protein
MNLTPLWLLWLRSIALISALLLAFGPNMAQDQDISGGAAGLSLPRPANPRVRNRKNQSPPDTKAGILSSAGSTVKTAEPPAAAEKLQAKESKNQSKAELREETEDALALGNSARDAKPPRYEDAERAYKLAAKLSPKDPRPHVGLGNIYYDQKRYAEAAEHYRTALRLPQVAVIGALIGGLVGGGKGAVVGAAIGANVPGGYAYLHAYTGESLLRQQKWAEAEIELKQAIARPPDNAQFYALLGYAQFEQKKYSEAVASYEKAVQLEPQNAVYKGLWESARREQKAITPE